MIKRLKRRMTLLVIGVLVLVSAGIVIAIYQVNISNIITQVNSSLDVLEESKGDLSTLPSSRPTHKPGSSSGTTEEDGSPEESTEEDGPPAIPEGDTEGGPPAIPEGDTEGGPPALPESLSGSHTPSDEDHTPPDKPDSEGRSSTWEPGPERRSLPGSLSREEVASLSNYYTVTLDEDGEVTSLETDREDLYNQEEQQYFIDQMLSSGTDSGQLGTQFYRILTTDSGKMLIVLDARLEIAAGQSVLKTTLLVAGIACLVLSLCAWLLIRRMVQPVEDAFTKQQQFIWDASHELKTPLAVIQANADVLEGEIGENEYLGYIRSEIRRTDSLVKNLLTLARMDRGTQPQEMTDLDMSETVLSVLLPFESTIYEAGKTLETEIADHVRCRGNDAMLQQLTVILLSNALKYSDAGGTIRVTLKSRGHGCELRVFNTGEGIGPRDLERIFDRFYRADSSHNSETGGEGLGLAIAHSIVRIHRGRIWAESELGKSATFIVSLP